jgi:hypothetical protein
MHSIYKKKRKSKEKAKDAGEKIFTQADIAAKALFIRLIIRLFQLVFSAGIIFFFHNKSANSVFQPAYQHSQTGSCSFSSENH